MASKSLKKIQFVRQKKKQKMKFFLGQKIAQISISLCFILSILTLPTAVISQSLTNLFPGHASFVDDDFYESHDESDCYDGDMDTTCRGNDVDCGDQLLITISPATNIGTFLLLNIEGQVFKGDLEIQSIIASPQTYYDIAFSGAIDINMRYVNQLQLTIQEFYDEGFLQNYCDYEDLRWREIRVYKERELTLFNQFSIQKSHSSNSILQSGIIDEITGFSNESHSQDEVQINTNNSHMAGVMIQFASPLAISQITMAQFEQLTVTYQVSLFAGVSTSVADQTENKTFQKQMKDIVVTIPLVQTIIVERVPFFTFKKFLLRKIFIFERLVPCSDVQVLPIDDQNSQFLSSVPNKTIIVGSQSHSEVVKFMRDWSDGCQGVTITYSITSVNNPMPAFMELVTYTDPSHGEQYHIQVKSSPLPSTSDLGQHSFTIEFELLDNSTGLPLVATASSWTVSITVKECSVVQVNTISFTDMSVNINGMPSVENYAWPTYQSNADPSRCGPIGVKLHSQAITDLTITLMSPPTSFDVTLQSDGTTYVPGTYPANIIGAFYIDFPSANPKHIGQFVVNILFDCSTTSIINQASFSPSNINHDLYSGTVNYQRTEPVSANNNCSNLAIVLEEVTSGALSRMVLSSISSGNINFEIQLPELVSHIGIYDFRLSIQNQDDLSSNKLYYPFQLVINGCTQTLLDPLSLQDMVYLVDNGPQIISQPLPVPVSQQSPLCGPPFTYQFEYPTSITFSTTTSPTRQVIFDQQLVQNSYFNTVHDIQLKITYSAYGTQLAPVLVTFKAIIYDCTQARVTIVSSGLANAIVTVGDQVTRYSLTSPTYLEPLFDCGPIIYSLAETYAFVTLGYDNLTNDWYIDVQATLNSEVGTWPVTLQASLLNHPSTPSTILSQESMTIQVMCTDTSATTFSIPTMIQEFGSAAEIYQFVGTARSTQNIDCGPFSYVLAGVDLTVMNLNTITTPNSSQNTGQLGLFELVLNANQEQQVKSYAYTIEIGLVNYPAASKTSIQFSAQVLEKPNSAPQFTSPVPDTIQLTKLVYSSTSGNQASLPVDPWNFFLPSYEDSDPNDTVTLTVDLGNLSSFASYDSNEKIISIADLNEQGTQEGNYEIILTLDDGELQVEKVFQIIIREQIFEQEESSNLLDPLQNQSENQSQNSTKNETDQEEQNEIFDSQGIETIRETQIFGGVEYSWQVPVIKFKNKRPDPLRLILRSLSATGNLTIAFNKPIYVPHLFEKYILNQEQQTGDIHNLKGKQARLLQDTQIKQDPFELLKDIIQVQLLNSEEFDQSNGYDKIPYVVYYNVTRFTSSAIDLQILWHQPNELTQDVTRPDQIQVWFKTNSLFVDKRDFQKLDQEDSKLVVDIIPQVSQQEMNELISTSETVQDTVNAFTTLEIILYTLMASGLKYLWNLINLLQFLVFMQKWRIQIPYKTLIWLQTLKAICLFEFLPKKWFTDSISDLLGFEVKSKNEDESHGQIDLEGFTDTELSQKTNIIENMGMMLLLACVLIIAMAFLGLIRFAIYRDYRIFRLYQTIRQRIFFNTIIRYILQSTLKLQMAAADTIVAEQLSAQILGTQLNFEKIIAPLLIIACLTACPFIFVHILRRNRPQLPYLTMQRRFGTLYLGLNAFWGPVEWASFSFLLRRSCFVLLTYIMMSFPGIQVQIFCFMSVLYLIFVNHMNYYGTRLLINLENLNEFFFLLICYNFVLYCNLVLYQNVKDLIGKSLLLILGLMIIVNTVVIMRVCLLESFDRWHQKYRKGKFARLMKEKREIRNQKYLRERKQAAIADEKKYQEQDSVIEDKKQQQPIDLNLYGQQSDSKQQMIEQKFNAFDNGVVQKKSRNYPKRCDSADTQDEQLMNNISTSFQTKNDHKDLKSLIYQNQSDMTNDAIFNSKYAALDKPLRQKISEPYARRNPFKMYPDLKQMITEEVKNDQRSTNESKLIPVRNSSQMYNDTNPYKNQIQGKFAHSPHAFNQVDRYLTQNVSHNAASQWINNHNWRNNTSIGKEQEYYQQKRIGDDQDQLWKVTREVNKNYQQSKSSEINRSQFKAELSYTNRQIQAKLRQAAKTKVLQRYTPEV